MGGGANNRAAEIDPAKDQRPKSDNDHLNSDEQTGSESSQENEVSPPKDEMAAEGAGKKISYTKSVITPIVNATDSHDLGEETEILVDEAVSASNSVEDLAMREEDQFPLDSTSPESKGSSCPTGGRSVEIGVAAD